MALYPDAERSVPPQTTALIADLAGEMNLKFVKPTGPKKSRLLTELDKVASGLGVTTPSFTFPEAVLKDPLTVEQKKKIDAVTGPIFAAHYVRMQDELVDVSIQESGEPMTDLRKLFDKAQVPTVFSDAPFHPACGEWAGKPRVFWLREGVAENYLRAGEALREIGVGIKFEDAFRPEGVQEGLFRRRIVMLQEANPNWAMDQIVDAAKSFTGVSPWLSGHKWGASADTTLVDLKTGQSLDLGHPYPQGDTFVALDCPLVTWDQFRTRALFAISARMVGKLPYPGEDWHASEGDVIAAMGQKGPNLKTQYGPLKGFEPSGKVLPYDPSEYYQVFAVK
jgi:D-alanyl-D-alanine dipeptidase